MAGIEKSQYAEILLSCIEEGYYEDEVILEHHSFSRIISGEMKVVQAGQSYSFGPGDTLMFPRNQRSTLMKNPKDGKPYTAVVVFFSPERLLEFYTKNPTQGSNTGDRNIRTFEKHPLLDSFFASLTPYFELQTVLPDKIISVKIEEALSILRVIDNNIDHFLSDFSRPDQIDLAGFMEQNFMFNMTMEKFGYLTGRSLTTFKRDFKKVFNTSPQKWIMQKRLELAHYQLAEKGRKPKQVYLDTGFENLSHFSFAFKKHYGYAPTEMPTAISAQQ